MADSELREVYTAADTQEAHLIQTALADAGIEAHVVGDQLQYVQAVSPTAVRVWVKTEQFDQAREIIANHQPHAPSTAPVGSEWNCPKCGEENEPTFEICWNCQTANAG
jgi:hypothetical protein